MVYPIEFWRVRQTVAEEQVAQKKGQALHTFSEFR
jgi:hypothetical protein